jgi:ATP-dependent DNA ligase
VRLVSRGSADYARRFPWIVEAARKRRQRQFIIDGEAVLLVFHGISRYKHTDKQPVASQTTNCE